MGASTLLCAVLLVGPDPSAAGDGPPSVFDISVVAAPVVDELALIAVVPLPLDNGVARSSVSMNSQPLVISQAAIVYAPLAETLAASQPPQVSNAAWCFSYFPSGPGNPAEARCGGGGALPGGMPVEAGSGHTVTSGDPDDPTTLRSRSSTRAAGIGGAGADLPAPMSIGSASSTAESRAIENRMTAAGSTALSDIEVGELLTIKSVTSFVTAALSGEAGGAAVESDLTIAGAVVAGQPVEIDEKGVHAVGQPALPRTGDDQQDQLDSVLAAAGIKVAVVPSGEPVISDDGREVRASSGSLRIEFNNFEAGVLSRFEIGGVDLAMQASQRDDATSTAGLFGAGGDLGPSPAAPVRGGEATSPDGGSPATRVGGADSIAPPPPPTPGEGAGLPTREVRQVAIEPIGDLWDLPYPRFALLVLAVPMLMTTRRFSIARRYPKP